MNKWSVAALLLSAIKIAHAAEAVIIGEGHLLNAPDYVELSILVDSKCYPTAAEARKINDDASRKIVDFLNTKLQKKDNYNSVTSSGGYTSSYQNYYQDKYLCQIT